MEFLDLEFSPWNLKRGSMASRFFDCGRRLCAAYGSWASPPGNVAVESLFGVDRPGLVSRDTDEDP